MVFLQLPPPFVNIFSISEPCLKDCLVIPIGYMNNFKCLDDIPAGYLDKMRKEYLEHKPAGRVNYVSSANEKGHLLF